MKKALFILVVILAGLIYGGAVAKSEKVVICHKGHTIMVSEKAVPAHLKHGDYLGECVDNSGPKFTQEPTPEPTPEEKQVGEVYIIYFPFMYNNYGTDCYLLGIEK